MKKCPYCDQELVRTSGVVECGGEGEGSCTERVVVDEVAHAVAKALAEFGLAPGGAAARYVLNCVARYAADPSIHSTADVASADLTTSEGA